MSDMISNEQQGEHFACCPNCAYNTRLSLACETGEHRHFSFRYGYKPCPSFKKKKKEVQDVPDQCQQGNDPSHQ